MSISIICPLYKGDKYISSLSSALSAQEGVEIKELLFILTETKGDDSKDILRKLGLDYIKISPNEFSHSLTREKAIYKCKGEIVVLITQDIKITDKYFIKKLTKDITEGGCDASFAKQICDNTSIEKYTRMNNYPNESRIVSKADLPKYGIQTYFFSDAASAIKKSTFVKLKGYDNKNLLTNEDMYFSYKLINNGYKIKYCSDAEVIHSHDYSLKTLFKRYFDQGVFLKQHEYIESAGSNSSALALLQFVLKNAIKEKNIKVLINIIPNFGVRFIANKLGHNYKKLSKKNVLRYTSNPNYWIKEVFTD